jgi:hypothetical protein
MKIVLLIAAFSATICSHRSFAQENKLPQLLSHYYAIKDALVAGNSNMASESAEQFIKTANAIDYKTISESNITALLKDATPLSEATDINIQRALFVNLSSNMAALAKAVKLTQDPVYEAYCPMKKASWLSPEKAIKNPYYGSAMLTCGKIVDTLQ